MNGSSIFVIQKGKERVTVPDKNSAVDLMYALNVLDCYEHITKQEIQGNREDLSLYHVAFMDKEILVVGQSDAEKVIHWMLVYGCDEVSIKKGDQKC